MSVTRSVVEMVSGKVKTEASQRTVPLHDRRIVGLVQNHAIQETRKGVCQRFTSCRGETGQPYWPMTIMRVFIKPVAKGLGIGNIGWHTLRHYADFRTIPGGGRTEPA